jgi:hypothetical protein
MLAAPGTSGNCGLALTRNVPSVTKVFVDEVAHRIACHWKRGRPSKRSTLKPSERAAQFSLFKPPSSWKMSGTGLTPHFLTFSEERY